MSWLVLSLLSLFSFVTYDLIGRYLATRSENPRAFAVIVNGVIALMGPLVFLVDKTLPKNINPGTLFLALIGLVLWGLMGRFEYYAKKHTEASVLAITAKIAPVLTFILSVLILKESFTFEKVLGIVLIVIANTILYLGQKKGTVISGDGFKYTLILVAILSVAWLMDAVNVKNWGVGTFTTLSYIAPCLISGTFPLIKRQELKKELVLTPFWQFIILGFFSFLGYASMLKAFTLGEASKVVPISTSTTPFIVLFGVILLGERNHLAHKLLASILTVIAIYLMR